MCYSIEIKVGMDQRFLIATEKLWRVGRDYIFRKKRGILQNTLSTKVHDQAFRCLTLAALWDWAPEIITSIEWTLFQHNNLSMNTGLNVRTNSDNSITSLVDNT